MTGRGLARKSLMPAALGNTMWYTGTVPPATGSIPVVAEQAEPLRLLEVGPDVCGLMLRSGLPVPCPCDGSPSSGCGSERVPWSGIAFIEPLSSLQRKPFPVGALYSLYDPQLSSPPPRRIS